MIASQHELEQLDNGHATCIRCGRSTAWGLGECVSTPKQKQPAPKPQERAKVSRDAEIELIKRQLSQLIHRVDGLKQKTA